MCETRILYKCKHKKSPCIYPPPSHCPNIYRLDNDSVWIWFIYLLIKPDHKKCERRKNPYKIKKTELHHRSCWFRSSFSRSAENLPVANIVCPLRECILLNINTFHHDFNCLETQNMHFFPLQPIETSVLRDTPVIYCCTSKKNGQKWLSRSCFPGSPMDSSSGNTPTFPTMQPSSVNSSKCFMSALNWHLSWFWMCTNRQFICSTPPLYTSQPAPLIPDVDSALRLRGGTTTTPLHF